MNEGTLYNILKWVAIAGVVLWLGYELNNHFASRGPGDFEYLAGNNFFKDHHYDRAEESYLDALNKKPDHLPALRGLANTYVQLKQYDQALTAINRAMELDPEFGGHYATRGIIYDRMGESELAIADYEKALVLYPEVAEGMHWLDRLLYNVHEAPPTIKDRLAYLKEQMSLPEDQRVLRKPDIDDSLRPYEQ
jgi:tetratricopeptide (TPR) repeat protein